MSFSMTIAKRGFYLGYVYTVIGAVMVVVGIVLTGLGAILGPQVGQLPSGVSTGTYLSLIGVPILSLAGLLAAMPVTLLFVHDKENGTLEYLLSMGFDQRDIFRTYLGASLVLGAPLLAVGSVAGGVASLLTSGDASLAGTAAVLVLALGLSTITLVTVLMTAFSALQRQPLGMNQPLGITIGALAIMAAVVVPVTQPQFQLVLELAISGIVVVVSLVLLALTPRLIRREKMLP